ncbi:DUF3857 domain-containing protein [Bacteroides sp. 214]|uniref:DUF3857 domain-containing protein n=1 Tax=Bacteroides sp. 214 TaxID=2302935 RepID=UPI0013D35C96|nr:DUF3857 domain-containing protein [Bacteroides sp. 214]
MKKHTLFTLLLGILLLLPGFTFASTNYQKAWEEFFANNRVQARNSFNEALNDPATQADAYLALSILDWSENKLEDAFADFTKFYRLCHEPDAFLYGLYTTPYTFADGTILKPEKLKFLEEIVDKTTNGTLRAMIYETLGKHYEGCNDFEKSAEYFGKVGALRNWQILGAFNNISGSGFEKEWGAVSKARTKDIFQNHLGATVGWYAPGLNKSDGWFDFTYYYMINDIVVYAQSFVTSPQPQEAFIRLGTSGSLKVWINDALVGSVQQERNCDMDVYSYKINLNKGVNRILVQVGQSEIEALNFMARLTDEQGIPLTGLQESADYASYTKASNKTNNNSLPFFPEAYLQERIKTDATNPLYALVLAETYLRNDKADEAILLLREVQKQAPKSSYVHTRLAEAYARAQNQTYYTKQIEDLKRDDPESFYALSNLSSEAISSNKINEVRSLNQKIKDLYGESLDTRLLDAWLANKQNNQEESIAIARENFAKYPYNYGYMNAVYNIEENTLKNRTAAEEIIKNYCENYFSPAAMGTLSGRYIKDGEVEKGLQILRDRIARMPYAIGFLQSFARTLYQMQRYDEALTIAKQMEKQTPYLSAVYTLQADILKAMKNEKQAAEYYKKAIHYNPVAFDARTQLRQLEGEKEIEDLFPRYNIDSLIAAAPSAEVYPDDHSMLVLYDSKQMFYPEGASEYHMEIAVKILNQTGVEIWKEYNVSAYSGQDVTIDKSEIIKANGQRVKAERNGGQVVFTNIEPGDALYLEYRIKEYATDVISKHIYSQDIFQYSMPSMVISNSLLLPKEKKFQYVVANGKIDPVITNMGDMKLYRWTSNNQPALRMEPAMSSFVDVVPTLAYSSFPDWHFIANWYKDLTTNKFKSDYLLQDTFDEILKGKENASPLEKAELFYEYIVKNITYSNVPFMQNNYIPQAASRTISTRLGDCKDVSTLFVALCRKAGIKANLVLLLSRDNGRNILPLPSNAFNHCIAQLTIDSKVYYLELTDSRLPFGSAPVYDLHSPILPIPYGDEVSEGKLLSMNMPFRMPNAVLRTSKYQFNNNDMMISTQTVRWADAASGFRHMYADLGAEEQLKQMSQAISSDYTTPVKVSNLQFNELTSLADTLEYSYEVEAKNIMQEIAGMKIFKIHWADQFASLEEYSLDTRKYPIEFWMLAPEDKTEEKVTAILPEGRKFMEVPKDIHLECDNAVYDLTFDAQTSGQMVITRRFQRKSETITPQQYDAFKEFVHAVAEADNKSYAM